MRHVVGWFVLGVALVGCRSGGEAPEPEPPSAPWASDAKELTLVNAYDAFGEPSALRKDFGFSTVVRYGGKTILFDAGTRADVFADNLKALGVDPREIDLAVASHRHHDHIAGFDYLIEQNPDVTLYLPKDFFGLGGPLTFSIAGREPKAGEALEERQRYFDGQADLTKNELVSTSRFWKAKVRWISEPTEVAPGVRILPTRSELMGTFARYPPHGDEPKLIGMPELSLVLSTSKGDVVVVGCSHSSVEEIVKAAKGSGSKAIDLVVGGYHLLPYERAAVKAIAERMKGEHGVTTVAPAHCSGHVAFDEFRAVYGEGYRFFGLGSRIEY